MPDLSQQDKGLEACLHIRGRVDTVLLGFSGGKDSLCAWLRLREYFGRIIPIFHYWLPALEFVERALTHYEERFRTPIVRVPHPGLMQMLRYGAFQPAHRYQICEWWNYASADFRAQADWVAADQGIELSDAWLAVGIRSADSVRRLTFFQRFGAVNPQTRKFYPIASHRKSDIVEMLRAADIKLAPEYSCMPRSFDGFSIEYLRPIRERFPRDFQRIKEWFPLIEAEFYRAAIYEQKES